MVSIYNKIVPDNPIIVDKAIYIVECSNDEDNYPRKLIFNNKDEVYEYAHSVKHTYNQVGVFEYVNGNYILISKYHK